MKPGDIVKIKSGGPNMVVVSADDMSRACIWYDITLDAVKNARVSKDALKLVEEGKTSE